MKLLYLYIDAYRRFENREFALDANDVFALRDGRLVYRREEKVPDGFFSLTSDRQSEVDSVSAMIGENGSGKTSFASILSRLFKCGRPFPRYVCIVKYGSKIVCYDNLENALDVSQPQDALGERFACLREASGWIPRKIPFHAIYLSPHLALQSVWGEHRQRLHDLSTYAFLAAGRWKNSDNEGKIDPTLARYVREEHARAFEFARTLTAAYSKKKVLPVPFPVPMNVTSQIDWNTMHDGMERCKMPSKPPALDDEVSRRDHLQSFTGFLFLILDYRIRTLACMASASYHYIGAQAGAEIEYVLVDRMASLCRFVVHFILKASNAQPADLKPQKTGFGFAQNVAEMWNRLDKKAVNWLLEIIGRELRRIARVQEAESAQGINWQAIAKVWSLNTRLMEHPQSYCDDDMVGCAVMDKDVFSLFLQLMSWHDQTGLLHPFLKFHIAGLASGEMAYLGLLGRLHECFGEMKALRKAHDANRSLGCFLRSVILFLDEAETTLHPGWQQELVRIIIWYVETFTRGLSVHVVFASHSPMLLSDIPKGNVCFVSSRASASDCERLRDTFGANVFDLYRMPFQVRCGVLGSFSKLKLNELLDKYGTDEMAPLARPIDRQIGSLFGDPMIHDYLKKNGLTED